MAGLSITGAAAAVLGVIPVMAVLAVEEALQ
jgi:hypothetical protein